MGTFRTVIEVGDSGGRSWERVEAVMDTGASYSWMPRDVLQCLGVQPQFRREFVTADGRVIEREMSIVSARLNGEVLPTLVVFGNAGSMPLLGAFTLEGFGLAPDPVNKRLVRVRGLAL